jgi:hypothetical protein
MPFTFPSSRLPRQGAFLGVILLFVLSACAPKWEIHDPYEQVRWEQDHRHKANFHTHTTRSDGRLNPHTVVDRYHELGYTILAITDHSRVTYPWTEFSQMEASAFSRSLLVDAPDTMPEDLVFEDRDPSALGMVDILGDELSSHHHMGTFFNHHPEPVYGQPMAYSSDEEESLQAVREEGGIVMLYHPGRYDRPLDWYLDLYARYDHLFGLEVYNQGDRYPDDRILWDSILTATMPDRPVWGYSNDDMHTASHLGRNWNVMILPGLSHEEVRRGMEEGRSYFVYAPQGHAGPQVPEILGIAVNPRRGTIAVSARHHEGIVWIAGGVKVHEGDTLALDEVPEGTTYVRAELHGAGNSVVGTQPFGIRRAR